MNCQKCGTFLGHGVLVCPNCGTPAARAAGSGSVQQGVPAAPFNPGMPGGAPLAPGYAAGMPRQNSTLAVVSLVCGIGSWVMLPVVGSIAAIITGHMARKEIAASFGRLDGDGLALAGLITGYTSLVLGCLGGLAFVLITLLAVGAAAAQ